MSDTPLDSARAWAATQLAAVVDDPQGRVRARERFYAALGGDIGPATSELAFTRWEARRGVLAAPGSPWWRAVNGQLVLDSETAAQVRGPATEGLTRGERAWCVWLASRRDLDWYRAHNTSVVTAYLAHRELAVAEAATERPFLNIVLYRVLFAQLMEEGKAAGPEHPRLGAIASRFADPCLPGVEVMVDLPAFYPPSWPLTEAELAAARGEGSSWDSELVRCFDQGIVLPEARAAYTVAAETLGVPELLDLVEDGRPFYPSPSDGVVPVSGVAVALIRSAVDLLWETRFAAFQGR